MRSSPNSLINVDSLQDIMQTCLKAENTVKAENISHFGVEIKKQPDECHNIISTSLNYSSDIEPVSDEEIDLPFSLISNIYQKNENLEIKSDTGNSKKNNVENDNDSISYISDDSEIDFVSEDENSIDFVKNEEFSENKTGPLQFKSVKREIVKLTSANELPQHSLKEDNDTKIDSAKNCKLPLTPEQEKMFDYKIFEYEQKASNKLRVDHINVNRFKKFDSRIVQYSVKCPVNKFKINLKTNKKKSAKRKRMRLVNQQNKLSNLVNKRVSYLEGVNLNNSIRFKPKRYCNKERKVYIG